MHELGIVLHVLDTVNQVKQENHLTKIGSITLEIGEVSGIVPKYLSDCYVWAIKKYEGFEDSTLNFEIIPAKTQCHSCHHVYPTIKYGKECPNCHSIDTVLLTGNQTSIKQIEAY